MKELPTTYKGAVYPWHCDHMGHMNVMWYTGKMDEATWNLFADLGLTPAFLKSNDRGMAALEIKTTYQAELLAGDVVSVRTRVRDVVKGKLIKFTHEMMKGERGDIAAVAEITGIHMDTKERKSTPFPADVLARIERMIEEHAQI